MGDLKTRESWFTFLQKFELDGARKETELHGVVAVNLGSEGPAVDKCGSQLFVLDM